MGTSARLDDYRGAVVLVSGDTGFKGSWLALWLARLGAKVVGYALPPVARGNWVAAGVGALVDHVDGDIRDGAALDRLFARTKPDVVFHLAAQSLVLDGYARPVETFDVNVQGTVQLLEAARRHGVAATVVVTTDKVYANEDGRACVEDDRLGGHDPYSASKAAAELVTAAYRASFSGGAKVASARAGNVIGAGDWADHRIVPDAIRALAEGRAIPLRNPDHTRPWQHVLEPLAGYLLLGLAVRRDAAFARSWNFGPDPAEVATVDALAREVVRAWGSGQIAVAPRADAPKEAPTLSLDAGLAQARLLWRPRLSFADTVQWTVDGYRAELAAGATVESVRAARYDQIDRYTAMVSGDAR